MPRMILALTTAFAGSIATVVGAGIAILAAGGGTDGASSYVSGLGGATAAAALVYIVKQMVDGKLVARDPARIEAAQADQLRQLTELLEDATKREDQLRQLYQQAIGAKP